MFKAAAGVDILHVPYRGAGPAVNDTVGGHVQLTFVGPRRGAKLGRCRPPEDPGGGAVEAARGRRRRYPTSAEAGLPGYEFVTWFGFVAPKGTPQPIIDKLVAQHPRDAGRPERQAHPGAERA